MFSQSRFTFSSKGCGFSDFFTRNSHSNGISLATDTLKLHSFRELCRVLWDNCWYANATEVRDASGAITANKCEPLSKNSRSECAHSCQSTKRHSRLRRWPANFYHRLFFFRVAFMTVGIVVTRWRRAIVFFCSRDCVFGGGMCGLRDRSCVHRIAHVCVSARAHESVSASAARLLHEIETETAKEKETDRRKRGTPPSSADKVKFSFFVTTIILFYYYLFIFCVRFTLSFVLFWTRRHAVAATVTPRSANFCYFDSVQLKMEIKKMFNSMEHRVVAPEGFCCLSGWNWNRTLCSALSIFRSIAFRCIYSASIFHICASSNDTYTHTNTHTVHIGITKPQRTFQVNKCPIAVSRAREPTQST